MSNVSAIRNSVLQRNRNFIVAVTTMKFLFGMCDCTVDSDVGTGYFWLVLEILLMFGRVHV